jgi:hypothetical protein
MADALHAIAIQARVFVLHLRVFVSSVTSLQDGA